MRQMTTVVQILVTAMIMLNGLLLIMTRQEYWPSILLLVLPVLQCYIVDRKKWYQLPSWASNTIGFGIGAYAVYYFLNNTPDRHLAIISDLVSYLIITLLFQGKSPRLYWQISILSVLQAVVASVFSLNLQQGILFVTYICVVVTGLSSIVFHRDQLMAAGRLDEMQNLNHPGQGLRMLKAGGSLRALANRQKLSRMAFRHVLTAIVLMATLSVASGMAVYVSMPNSDQQQGVGTMRLKRTGVDWEIRTLEPSGVLAQDTSEALRLRILDPISNLPKRLVGDVYLRGSVLEVLQQEETAWSPLRIRGRRFPLIENPRYDGRVYTQEIILNPSEDPMLFLVPPTLPDGKMPEEAVYDIYSETLFRNPDGGVVARTPFRYQAGLYALRNDSIPESTPFLNFQNYNYEEPLARDFPNRANVLKEVNRDKFPGLSQKADEIASAIPGKNRMAIARALNDYLAFSGRYNYTTDFTTIQRNKELDPVEDFFTNYRRGHCELYASALAIMCRTQGIPARVVVGYRVNRYNEVAGHYQVLKKHAHSWVEVYLQPLDCSNRMKRDGEAGAGGAWLRLDPTPPASVVEELDTSLIAQANDALGYAQSLWDDYVLGMKPQDKQAGTTWSMTWYRLQNIFDLTNLGTNLQTTLQRLTAWQRAGLAGLIAFLLAWWNYARNKGKTKSKNPYRNTKQVSGWRKYVPFANRERSNKWEVTQWADDVWMRFENLLVSSGFDKRRRSQTPKEYVAKISQGIDDSGSHLVGELSEFTDEFYLVRYGRPDGQSDLKRTETLFTNLKSGLESWIKTKSKPDSQSSQQNK